MLILKLNMKVKLQISDSIWWGFNEEYDLENYHNIQGLIDSFLNYLETVLESLNLIPQKELLVKVKKDFHIHDKTFEDILMSADNDIIYVCRHNINDGIKLN
jgi:hypothetical protein